MSWTSTKSKYSVAPAALMSAALILLCGCSDSGFESQFVYSPRTLSLVNEAQNGTKELPGIRKLVDDRFGNPQNLKAWLKLPIDFGGATAVVGAVPVDAADAETLTLTFSEDEGNVVPAEVDELLFVNGGCAGELVSVTAWDADTKTATLKAAPEGKLAEGDLVSIGGGSVLRSGRGLYQRHCSHCHGTSGDGNGPTATYLYPRPRDYRHGIFKFTSTNDLSKASRADLTRVLKQGIPGTYMPSFLLLPDSEIHALVEYVRFLSMRGEYERKLVNEVASDYSTTAVQSRVKNKEPRADIIKSLNEFLAEEMPDLASGAGDDLAEAWSASDTEEALIIPSIARVPDSAESRRKGRELYLSKTLNCADCHGISGQGNGPQTTIFEKNPITNELYTEPGLHDVWDNVNQPRNLTYGIYRGGRRPVDLFARIHAGIKGSRMPSFKNTPHEDIWHVVNYVLSIPFEVEPGAAGAAAAAPAAAVVPPTPAP